MCTSNDQKESIDLFRAERLRVYYPNQVIRGMNLLFAIKNESEMTTDLGGLGSVLMSLW